MISLGRWCHIIWILTDELILEQIRNMLFLTCSSVNWCINIYISHGTMKKVPYVGLYTDYIYMYGLVISFDYCLIILYVERNGVGLHLTVTHNCMEVKCVTICVKLYPICALQEHERPWHWHRSHSIILLDPTMTDIDFFQFAPST